MVTGWACRRVPTRTAIRTRRDDARTCLFGRQINDNKRCCPLKDFGAKALHG